MKHYWSGHSCFGSLAGVCRVAAAADVVVDSTLEAISDTTSTTIGATIASIEAAVAAAVSFREYYCCRPSRRWTTDYRHLDKK